MEHSLTQHPESFRKGSLWGPALLAALALLAGMTLWMVVSHYRVTPKGALGQAASDIGQTAFIEKTGIRVTQVALTAGGGMIDVRYQVIDPDKAAIVHDKDRPPTIVDEATGQAMDTPWMAHARKHELHGGVTYFELLLNAEGAIKPGEAVTVVLGGVRLEHVIVQ